MFLARFRSGPLMIAVLLMAVIVTSCATRRRHMLTDERYAPTPAAQEIKLYVNEVRRPHIRIAIVQSFSEPEPDAARKREMLEALTTEARKIGADAVMNVRQLKNQVRGAVVDEAVPFRSYRQGRYDMAFMRGTAIRFVDEAEPPTGPTTIAPIEPARVDQGIPALDSEDPEEDLPFEVVPRGLGPPHY
jgi:uncharacterized protein YbjQ (UPF0145 family)